MRSGVTGRAVRCEAMTRMSDEKGEGARSIRTCHPDPKIGQIVKGFFMMKFETPIESPRSFDDTVKAIEQKAAEKGFRVLHTHTTSLPPWPRRDFGEIL